MQHHFSLTDENKKTLPPPWEVLKIDLRIPDFIKKIYRESLDGEFACSEIELSGKQSKKKKHKKTQIIETTLKSGTS